MRLVQTILLSLILLTVLISTHHVMKISTDVHEMHQEFQLIPE